MAFDLLSHPAEADHGVRQLINKDHLQVCTLRSVPAELDAIQAFLGRPRLQACPGTPGCANTCTETGMLAAGAIKRTATRHTRQQSCQTPFHLPQWRVETCTWRRPMSALGQSWEQGPRCHLWTSNLRGGDRKQGKKPSATHPQQHEQREEVPEWLPLQW